MNFIEIDAAGWIEQNRGRNPWELFREVLQNAFDAVEEVGGGQIRIVMNTQTREIEVVDDGPGYNELKHAWTVYGGDKGDDPTKRGRFSRGIKETLAGVEYARVHTTSGEAEFFVNHEENEYDREVDEANQRESGTSVTIRNSEWSTKEFQEMREYVDRLWVPEGMEVEVDTVAGGETTKGHTEASYQFEGRLPTVLVVDQVLQEEKRHAEVEVRYSAKGSGTIYEMGIPVVTEWEVPYDVNVKQRIPMAEQRNEVDNGFMRRFLPTFVNNMFGEFRDELLTEEWLTENIDSVWVDDEVQEQFVERRFREEGDKEVVTKSGAAADDKVDQHGFTTVDPYSHSSSVKSVLRSRTRSADEVAHEIQKREETQVEMRAEQEEFVSFMLQVVDEVEDLHAETLSVEMWELAPGQDGEMPMAQYEPKGHTVKLNTRAHSWDEVNQDTVGTFIHEVAHRTTTAHSLDWAKEMERIFASLLAERLKE